MWGIAEYRLGPWGELLQRTSWGYRQGKPGKHYPTEKGLSGFQGRVSNLTKEAKDADDLELARDLTMKLRVAKTGVEEGCVVLEDS